MQPPNGDENSAPKSLQRKVGPVFYLKLVLIPACLAALVYALGHSDASLRTAPNLLALLGGVGLFLVAAVLAGLRMALTLRAGSGVVAPGRAVKIHFQSMFYHLFIPFGVGLDGSKFVMLNATWTRGKATLAMLLLLDRTIGFASFALLSVVLGIALFQDTQWLAIGVALLGGAAVAVAALALLAAWLVCRLPEKRARQLQDLKAVVRARPHLLLASLALSLAIQVIMGISVWLAARGWSIDLSVLEAVFATASAFLFQLIPLQVLGAGGAEAAGLVIYGLLGLSAAQAALLVSVAYGYRIVAAILGGAWDVLALLTSQRHNP